MADEPDNPSVKDLSRAYKDNSTIGNYLRLRREHPDVEIEVAIIGGIDQLFHMEDELKRHGIPDLVVAGTMDANPAAISELCLILLEKLAEREKREKEGATQLVARGLAIPDQLVDWLIAVMLDAQSWTGSLELSRDLIVLIRHRLIGQQPSYGNAIRAAEGRMKVIAIAAQMIERGQTPSLRDAAGWVGVNHTTVARWFPEGDLLALANGFAEGLRQIRSELSAFNEEAPD
jgi:hypothetical protein